MVRRSALSAAIALVAASVLGAVLLGSNQACTKHETVVADPPVVIGATVDLTKQKDFGAGSQRVLRVAEQQLNAVGGILGRRVVIDVRDDAGDNKLISGISEDFITRRVAGFIGPSTSEALEIVHSQYKDAKIPILSPFTTSPRVPLLQMGRDRYLFRTACAVEYQARAIARYALGASFAPPGAVTTPGDGGFDSGITDSGSSDASDASDATTKPDAAPAGDAGAQPPFKACTKMAAIYAEDAPGAGSSTIEALKTEYSKFGGVIKEFIVKAGAASYAADVAKVVDAAKAGEVECQTMLLFPADGGKYMRELRNVTANDTRFSASSFLSFGFIRFYQQGFIEAGRIDPKNASELSKVDGVLGAACNQQRDTSPEWTRFAALYNSQFPPAADAGAAPSPIPQIYDSVILLALAIESVGNLDDRVAIRDALYTVSAPPGEAYGPGQLAEALDAVRSGRDIDYTGAAGTFDLDDKGDTALEVILWKVSGNGFVTIPGLRPSDLRQ
jgi:ABC-type branched-subunit amino acid transport system substrate-binding protein